MSKCEKMKNRLLLRLDRQTGPYRFCFIAHQDLFQNRQRIHFGTKEKGVTTKITHVQ